MKKETAGYVVTWKGIPQSGLWAVDEESLQDLIDARDLYVKRELMYNPHEWKIVEARIVLDKEPRG